MHGAAGWGRSIGRGHRLELMLATVSHGWLAVRLATRVEPPAGRIATFETYSDGLLLAIAAGLGLGLAGYAVGLHAATARRKRYGIAVAGLASVAAVACGIAMAYASLIVVLLTLGVITIYALAGRFIAPVGIVCVALVHTLAIAAANPAMTFAYPLLLAFTHVLAGQALVHYLSLSKRKLRQADWVAISAGWVFWVLVILRLTSQRMAATGGAAIQGPLAPGAADLMRWIWVGPMIAFILFTVSAAWLGQQKTRLTNPRSLSRMVTGWLMIYNAAWLASAHDWTGAGLIAGLIVAWISGRIVLRRKNDPASYEFAG